MKSKTTLLYITFFALIALIVLMFMPYPGQDELAKQADKKQVPTQNKQEFNPQYGDLNDEQIAIADRAIGDLLNSVEGINPAMIAVKSFVSQEFGDTSLGCPNEGQNYAEVITPGYQVILEAQGQEYDYRLDTDKIVVMCSE